MKSGKSLAWIVASAATAGAVAAVLMHREAAVHPAAVDMVSSTSAGHSPAPPNGQATWSIPNNPGPPTASQQPVSPSMAREFSHIEDGRAFVLKAWTQPERGGRFYASRLVDWCAHAKANSALLETAQPDVNTVGAENLAPAAQALDLLQRRCGQFTQEELDKYSGQALLKSHDADKFVQAVQSYVATRRGSEEERARGLTSVLQQADPLLIDDIRSGLLMHSGPQGAYAYFDGQRYRAMDDPAIISAMYLVPCELGLDCSASTDGELAMRCASGAGCYADRLAVLQSQYASDPKRIELIRRYAEQLAQAIRSGNYGKFIEAHP